MDLKQNQKREVETLMCILVGSWTRGGRIYCVWRYDISLLNWFSVGGVDWCLDLLDDTV